MTTIEHARQLLAGLRTTGRQEELLRQPEAREVVAELIAAALVALTQGLQELMDKQRAAEPVRCCDDALAVYVSDGEGPMTFRFWECSVHGSR